MPTIKPRLMVTISEQQSQLLAELGRLQGRSRASYLVELLNGAEPLLGALLPVLRAHAATVEGQPVAMRDVVAKVFSGAYGNDPDQLDLVTQLAEAQERAEARTARSGAREERAPAPPSSNTGVSFAGHDPKGGSKQGGRAVSRG
jgi:hypothetical protein